jgi:hypothetical protein
LNRDTPQDCTMGRSYARQGKQGVFDPLAPPKCHRPVKPGDDQPGGEAYLPGSLKYFCRYFGSGGAWFFWIGIK